MAAIQAIFPPLELGQADAVPSALPALKNAFQLDPQGKKLWCWAATTISAARYLQLLVNADQCLVAKEVIKNCTDCGQSVCNRVATLQEGFNAQKMKVSPEAAAAPTSKTIEDQLNADRPVLCEVRLEPNQIKSSTHAVVIVSFVSPEMVEVLDPDTCLAFYEGQWKIKWVQEHCVSHYLP